VGKWMIAAASVLAWTVDASARSALIAAGGCEDPELLNWSGQLAELLREQMGQQLLAEDELMRRLPRFSSRAPAELERQLEGASRAYFQADYAAADQRTLEALAEVEHLRPGPRRWLLYVRGLLLRALILRARNRTTEAAEQIRRVLRVDPSHRLDSDYFPPSMRAVFDRLRRQLLREPKAVLAVTSTPAGSAIFIDGLDVQQVTPATVELVAGRYSIAVSKDGRFSFPRTVDLTSSAVQFDLAFESSVRPAPIPCIDDEGDEQLRLSNALKLGGWLGIEEVLLIEAARRSAGDAWVSAALLRVHGGQRIREGWIIASGSAPSSSELVKLAELIATGKPSGNVHQSDIATASPLAEQMAKPPAAEQVRVQTPLTASSKTWPKILGAALLGTGALAVGGGVLLQLRSAQSWANLSRRYADGTPPAIGELAAVQSIRKQADWQRHAAFASYALGATAACTGALFILSRSGQADRAAKTAIRAAPGAVSIEGSW
jgi:tetratricopeptide (TPR) repeat protein